MEKIHGQGKKRSCKTFFRLSRLLPRLDAEEYLWLQFGHCCRDSRWRCMMDCRMEENGVTPIPVAI